MQIETYHPGDEQGILELFARVFGQNKDLDKWRWENMDNPRGASLFALLKEDNTVRGHLCLQLGLVKLGEETVLCGQRINSMIEQKYRHKGVFEQMFLHLLEQAHNRKLGFIFGFPNAQSLRALQKIYPTEAVAQTPRFLKFYRGEAAVSRKINHPVLSRAAGLGLDVFLYFKNRKKASTDKVSALKQFDQRIDQLWQQVSAGIHVAVVRDSAYLNWRYIDSPTQYQVLVFEQGGEVQGYIVLLAEPDGMGHIVDLVALEQAETVPALLSAADEYLRPRCSMLSCWCLDQGQVSPQLRRYGFFSLPSQNTLAVSNIGVTKQAMQVLLDREKWYVMIGDSDYV